MVCSCYRDDCSEDETKLSILQVGGAFQPDWQSNDSAIPDDSIGSTASGSSAGQKMNCRIKRAAQRRDACSESFAPANMIGRVIWRTRGTDAVGRVPANRKAAPECMEVGAFRPLLHALSASVY